MHITPPMVLLAREIRAHEERELTRHLACLGLDEPCRCEDCTGNYKYPETWYVLARRIPVWYRRQELRSAKKKNKAR